jgi:hypothetical protein
MKLSTLLSLLQLAGKTQEEASGLVSGVRAVLAQHGFDADNDVLDANAAEYIERIAQAKRDSGEIS